ncbi:DUF6954 family protein [Geosporobacter ferrireducens]|uniref:Uncharacterized protein n=1 Tax=Geosporobacter ferrireducens TaxID=1424294 RepID=A0A1D8GCH2_9FIRM|nr:hypothetical protein [Geosporobacter ferrireducens]AOT68607.1 hypothetical protein Gferi_02745 [Geosporobacter ferrireducens]MTI54078.1 hypothetical protein [Geosporobacter ferrireducens]
MKKILVYTLFAVLFLLLTFFGMGPVMLADGDIGERALTFIAVLCGYTLLLGTFRWWRKRYNKK